MEMWSSTESILEILDARSKTQKEERERERNEKTAGGKTLLETGPINLYHVSWKSVNG